MKWPVPFVLLLLWTSTALAQPLEVISLQHRRAGQVLPQLMPFVEAGGALSGVNDMLFLRASPRNQAEIRRLVAALDTPPRRLVIRVRQEGERAEDATGASFSGRVVLGAGAPGTTATAHAYQSERRNRSTTQQEVQTIEDGQASIFVGQSLLLPLRQVVLTPAGVIVAESLVQRDLGTGFVAVPHLDGERVTLEISPVDASAGSLPDSVNVMRLFTTVSGRLGEWMELGASSSEERGDTAGIARHGTHSASRQRRLLLQVEALP
ncbi:MAG: hypothetical protein HZB64_03710 [Rhodocyclales bacterium]|nr:hypothetical protein [Rhodocyclales bacterium]